MSKPQEIKAWLEDKQRKYSEGVALFNACASKVLKDKYSAYFEKNKDAAVGGVAFNMLISQLTIIAQSVAAAAATSATTIINSALGKVVQDPVKIKAEDLTAEELPKPLRLKLDLVRELTPEIANLHTKLKDENLTDEEARALAEELCEKDDNRATMWAEIDDFLQDNDKHLEEIPTAVLPENPIAKGAYLVSRKKLVEGYISRDEKKLKGQNKPNIKTKIEGRLDKLRTELEQIEEQLIEAGS